MTDVPRTPPPGEGQRPGEPGVIPRVAARLALYQRAGGIVTPLLTTLLAFFVGGLVVLVISGKNPLATYKEIFNGTGLNWLLPWTCHYGSSFASCTAAGNLQQTLVEF